MKRLDHFSLLSNSSFYPTWIELDRNCRRQRDARHSGVRMPSGEQPGGPTPTCPRLPVYIAGTNALCDSLICKSGTDSPVIRDKSYLCRNVGEMN